MYFWVARVDGVGSDAPDLLLMTPGLHDDICSAINTQFGIANKVDGTPPDDSISSSGATLVTYQGALTSFPNPTPEGIALGNNAPQIAGKRTFCVTNTGINNYFYHVLIAR